MNYRHPILAGSIALFAGCASLHEPIPHEPIPDEPPDLDVVITPRPVDAELPRVMTSMEACLLDGGGLVEVGAVDNDDTREHGAIWTIAIAPDRRIAVAAEDGSIKLWTLDGFLGELDPGAFLYGAEVDGAQVPALAFLDDMVVAGDVRGVVSAWQDGFPRIVGGTNPDVRIVAVAVDPVRRLVAHADETVGGNVMVRGVSDPVTFGPLATELSDVTGLAYVGGRLLLAGARGGHAALELHGRDDPTETEARFESEGWPISEVAVSDGGETIAFVTADSVGVTGSALTPRWRVEGEHLPVSVAVGGAGRVVFTAGAEGRLAIWSAEDGRALGGVDVADPVAVRIDAAGDLTIVASRDGILRAFACAP